MCSAELAVSYLDRTDLAHVAPSDLAFDAMGKGESEGRAGGVEVRATDSGFVSKGLVRSKTDRLMLVRGGVSSPSESRAAQVARPTPPLKTEGATALKQEVSLEVAREAVAEELSALAWSEPQGFAAAKDAVADKKAEARMKGYVGEACPGMRQLHACAEWHLPEVRHLRRDDGVQLISSASRNMISSMLVLLHVCNEPSLSDNAHFTQVGLKSKDVRNEHA